MEKDRVKKMVVNGYRLATRFLMPQNAVAALGDTMRLRSGTSALIDTRRLRLDAAVSS